jgi:hypothetical protein
LDTRIVVRYQQTAIHLYGTREIETPRVASTELRGLLFSTLGFVVFVAIFAFVAYGDSLG